MNFWMNIFIEAYDISCDLLLTLFNGILISCEFSGKWFIKGLNV